MRRLAVAVLVALVSCVWPADTEAQQCDGVLIRAPGADICVATPALVGVVDARVDSLVDAIEQLQPGDPVLDSLRAELAAHLSGHGAGGVSRAEWDAHQIEYGQLAVRLDSLIAVLLSDSTIIVPMPPPVDTTDVPPPPPDTAEVPMNTAIVGACNATTCTVEYRFTAAPWTNVSVRTAPDGGGSNVGQPALGVSSPHTLSVPRTASDRTVWAYIVQWESQPPGAALIDETIAPIVIPGTSDEARMSMIPASFRAELPATGDEVQALPTTVRLWAILYEPNDARPYLCEADGLLHEALLFGTPPDSAIVRANGNATNPAAGGPCSVAWCVSDTSILTLTLDDGAVAPACSAGSVGGSSLVMVSR